MTTRQLGFFYGALFLLIVLPLTLGIHLKPLPTAILIGVLALNAVLSAWTLHPARQRFSGRLLVALVGCGLVIDTFTLGVWLVPPVSGEHAVMPMGQWFTGLIVGASATVLLSYFYFFRRVQHDRLEKIVLLLVLAVLATQAVFHFWTTGEL